MRSALVSRGRPTMAGASWAITSRSISVIEVFFGLPAGFPDWPDFQPRPVTPREPRPDLGLSSAAGSATAGFVGTEGSDWSSEGGKRGALGAFPLFPARPLVLPLALPDALWLLCLLCVFIGRFPLFPRCLSTCPSLRRYQVESEKSVRDSLPSFNFTLVYGGLLQECSDSLTDLVG